MKLQWLVARMRLAMCSLVVATIVTFAAATAAAAAPAFQVAPLNPDFLKYQQQLLDPLATPVWAAPNGFALRGLTPAPVDMSVAANTRLAVGTVSYPVSYDLRTLGRVTPVRDQGQLNTCWSFATFGSLESTLLPGETLNFSEDNLAVNSGFDYPVYGGGGNEFMSAAYLSGWIGPVYETDDPYGDHTSPAGLEPRKHVQNILFLPNRANSTDNDTIKWALTNYGAVYTDLRWPDTNGTIYNPTTDAFYYSGAAAANHAVDIVGWNDSYSRFNFATTPPGDGAFIVRNSWGSGWGDGGYFYVSYYDSIIGNADNTVFTAEATSDYTKVYQYDRYGWCTSIGWGSNTAWMANSFTAGGNEALQAVSFYAPVPSTSYSIYLGTSLTSRSLLDSGTLAVAGYRTIVLPTPQVLTGGSKFFVIVELTAPGAGGYPIPVESAETGYSSAATSAAGQSYASPDGTGGSWSDTGAVGSALKSNVALKAFTVPAASDLTAPTTTVSGIPAGWSPAAVKATFKATDTGGSGIGMTLFRIDSNPERQGTVATVSLEGIHTLYFHSVDMAGNPESDNSATVKIDTHHPTTKALVAVSANHRATATLTYKVVDAAPNGGTATVTIKVKTLTGHVVKTYLLGTKNVDVTLSLRMLCALPRGTYRYWVYAKDSAGNAQSSAGYNKLVVK
jgi:C1A family cysteine protease